MQAQTVTITRPQPADLRPVSVLGETDTREAVRTMLLAETNVDDMPGELFGHALERLSGAR